MRNLLDFTKVVNSFDIKTRPLAFKLNDFIKRTINSLILLSNMLHMEFIVKSDKNLPVNVNCDQERLAQMIVLLVNILVR